jgi:hemerythrin-like domain-containing protein
MTSVRALPLDLLISTLVSEHLEIKNCLLNVRRAIKSSDFEGAKADLANVDKLFRQHIADEEGTILRLFIGTLGRKGSEEAIRIFQQHRPIYQLMESIKRFSELPTVELEKRQDDLMELLDRHTGAEERDIFPEAQSLGPTSGRAGRTTS